MEKKKTRILAVGDIHGDTRLVSRLAKKAQKENIDLVILAGDLTSHSETPNLIKPFKEANKKVLLIPGNWDSFATTDFLAEIYGVRNIHGYSVKYDDIGFFGAGGAEGPGEGRITDEEIFQTLVKAHSGLKDVKKKVMITHMHPANSKSEFSGVPGSSSIEKAIKKFKPDFLLHSHIHEAGGVEEKIGKTRVINVSRKEKIFEI
ncbi:MAG: metallophosphoesterase [Nanoarchaeota archaeon]|nr:metallophosphoesterase [Nanoarchaeota archaeon]